MKTAARRNPKTIPMISPMRKLYIISPIPLDEVFDRFAVLFHPRQFGGGFDFQIEDPVEVKTFVRKVVMSSA